MRCRLMRVKYHMTLPYTLSPALLSRIGANRACIRPEQYILGSFENCCHPAIAMPLMWVDDE